MEGPQPIIDVSIIIPVHNGGLYLGACLESVFLQQHLMKVQVVLFLDSCTDDSEYVVTKWTPKLDHRGYYVCVLKEDNNQPKGVGYARNRAVEISQGDFLCFLDADDIMAANRLQSQYELAKYNDNAIIGSKFIRDPPESTKRFTKWANSLTPVQLMTQIYTSNGPTVIMPTWFFHKSVFHRVGGFNESGKGTPEDLIFFYTHLRNGGQILRHDEELLVYRYHPMSATFSVDEQIIWDFRTREIQEQVIKYWDSFTVWNAGKQGRKFYRSLSLENQKKVIGFCDVDAKKVGRVYTYEESDEKTKPKVPIIHFSEAKPPLIICMKMDLTSGEFEENLTSLNLTEGKDYWHFN